jgi:excinuclease ABC subunit C
MKYPRAPGCYMFKDTQGKVLYVGKAKALDKRLKSYSAKTLDIKTDLMIKDAATVDYFVTNTEVEALILENNLIKHHAPKYNILLKDSKRYAYLRLTDEEFPRLVLARKQGLSGKYFGPFVSAETRDYVLSIIKKTLRLRACKRLPKRACIRHHMNLCDAPCIGNISKREYDERLKLIERLFKGETKNLLNELAERMKSASQILDFERAKEIRDQMKALEYLSEKQAMETQKKYDEDIINYIVKEGAVFLLVFNVHKGILENKQEYEFKETPDFLNEFIVQYYSETKIPK